MPLRKLAFPCLSTLIRFLWLLLKSLRFEFMVVALIVITQLSFLPILPKAAGWLLFDFVGFGNALPRTNISTCSARVQAPQSVLFDPDIYSTQYNEPVWKATGVISNSMLCPSGFQGNPDIYGIGIRIGIYLQWLSISIAHVFSQDLAESLRQVYLISSIGIAATIFRMTFQTTCNFAMEIMIAYWLFCSGAFLVDFTQADSGLKGNRRQPKGLTWAKSFNTILRLSVLAHSTWFWSRGYDRQFVRMPCVTIHVPPFLGSMREPVFLFVRMFFALWTLIGTLEHSILLPLMIYIFAAEIQKCVVESPTFRGLFPRYRYLPVREERFAEGQTYFQRKLTELHGRAYSKLAPRLRDRFVRMFLEDFVVFENKEDL